MNDKSYNCFCRFLFQIFMIVQFMCAIVCVSLLWRSWVKGIFIFSHKWMAGYLEIGKKLLLKYEETRQFGLFP